MKKCFIQEQIEQGETYFKIMIEDLEKNKTSGFMLKEQFEDAEVIAKKLLENKKVDCYIDQKGNILT